jgi:hypothetical protein
VQPIPSYPSAVGKLDVLVRKKDQLPDNWQAPECADWEHIKTSALIAAAGKMIFPEGKQSILKLVGNISAYSGLQYWSQSRNDWKTLISRAHALSAPEKMAVRPDFQPDEIAIGKDYFFWQEEPTTSGSATYAFRLLELSDTRLTISLRNITPARHLMINVLDAGNAQTLYFFEHLHEKEWGYYQLSRIGTGLHEKLPIPEASYANRARAIYSHFARINIKNLPKE